ncbi:MAG: DNA-invertase [Hyphomicrobium sp.]|nr:DNA-invertase [Hyphomicrobium sp.]
MLIGYIRHADNETSLDNQKQQLANAGCTKFFDDVLPLSRRRSQPGLKQALAATRHGDVLVVTRLSTLSYSLKHLTKVMAQLQSEGLGFIALEDGIDTRDPGGKAYFQLLPVLTAFHRESASERSRCSVAKARAGGADHGRPPKLTTEQKREIVRRLKKGDTQARLALDFGVSRATISRVQTG